MAKILITGGTGSLGAALVRRWNKEHEITILSRNPHRQLELAEKFGLSSGSFVLGDICDYETVRRACVGQDILIHAAALKTVGQGEDNPEEYLRVNIWGTQVVARAWRDTYGVSDLVAMRPAPMLPRKALYINSDKAVAPVNLYGISKAAGEKVFLAYGFSSIRYGNVVDSEGSFVHKWREQLERGEAITVRRPEPTRFFVAMEQAVDLVEEALRLMSIPDLGFSGPATKTLQAFGPGLELQGVFVPHSLKSFSVWDVVDEMTEGEYIHDEFGAGEVAVGECIYEDLGPGEVAGGECIYEDLGPGEKQHEVLLGEQEVLGYEGEALGLVRVGRAADGRSAQGWLGSTGADRMGGSEVLAEVGL